MNNSLNATDKSVEKIDENVDKLKEKVEVINIQSIINAKDIEQIKNKK